LRGRVFPACPCREEGGILVSETAGNANCPWGIISSGVLNVKEVVLHIPEEIQDVLGIKRNLAKEITKRLAVSLYAERKISLGKAVELSGMDYSSFMELLGNFGIYLDYDKDELMSDLETIRRLEHGGDK